MQLVVRRKVLLQQLVPPLRLLFSTWEVLVTMRLQLSLLRQQAL
jgi:hypothetical protein